jgi:hypothetical protein
MGRPPGDDVRAAAGPASAPEVTNLAASRFECVYPTCGGLCCMNGRPAVEPDEEARIRANVDKFVEHLKPEIRATIAVHGFLNHEVKTAGRPTIHVAKGWCVFFQDGCVLQKVGAAEGDAHKYKPWRCSLFPLRQHPKSGEWFVRQHGLHGETWDLFCLNPKESPKSGEQTLQAEVAHLKRLVAEGRAPPRP